MGKAFFAFLMSALPCLAISAPIKIRAVSSLDNAGVKSEVWRKPHNSTDGQQLSNTDVDGSLDWNEPACEQGTMFLTIPVNNATYLYDSNAWQQCVPGGELVFKYRRVRLSASASMLIGGTLFEGIPTQYQDASKEVSKLIVAGNWGGAAKITSQLSSQMRELGDVKSANVFGEISMFATAKVAIDENAARWEAINDILVGNLGSSTNTIGFTTEARDALAEFQRGCGVRPTGQADWDTMSCLPGGRNFRLDSAILSLPQM